MTITNKVSLKSVMAGVTPIADVPDAPTIGAATNVGTSRAYNNGSATVAYTAAPTGGTATTFTATSTPGSFTGTGTSPITVTGLQSATSYTFTVTPTNSTATGPASSASSSITATTVPAAPTIGTFTDGGTGTTGTLSFTAGATGGSTITNYKYSTDSSTYTALSPAQTSSPLSLTGLTAGTYNFSVKAVNANGDSAASSTVSGTVITPTAFESIATANPSGTNSVTFSNIPQTYKSLQIRGVGTAAFNQGYSIWIRVNGLTADYSYNILRGSGTASTNSSTNIEKIYMEPGDQPAFNYPGVFYLDIIDYTSSTKKKTLKGKWGTKSSSAGGVDLFSGANWTSTTAITSITLYTNSGNNFSTNSQIALYGVQ